MVIEAERYDAVVIGAGPAGLTAALALASVGARVACAGPLSPRSGGSRPDRRTTALMMASVRLLDRLGVWPACAGEAAALERLRIIDDTGRLLRAPDMTFEAGELALPAFGYNIANDALVAALRATAASQPGLTLFDVARVEAVEPDTEAATVRLSDGRSLAARLVVGADGKGSLARAAAGIGTVEWSYDQAAIACTFDHRLAHDHTCNELHRAAGPLTTVPLPGRRSSLVWVETRAEAARLMALEEDAFAAALHERLYGLLGDIGGVGPRAAFPLSGLTATGMARNRVALVGEAAHVLPPIGAQGLNLGFRDAAALAECMAEALAAGGDPGGPAAMAAYDRARRGDVLSRTLAVDALNRSLVSGLLPLQAARGLGLHLVQAVPPLRRFLMRQGVAPSGLPPLMREEAARG